MANLLWSGYDRKERWLGLFTSGTRPTGDTHYNKKRAGALPHGWCGNWAKSLKWRERSSKRLVHPSRTCASCEDFLFGGTKIGPSRSRHVYVWSTGCTPHPYPGINTSVLQRYPTQPPSRRFAQFTITRQLPLLLLLKMDLSAKLSACEVQAVACEKISIRDIILPAKIVLAKRVPTRFNREAVLLEIITFEGERRCTFLPGRFEYILTDEDLEYITYSKQYSVKCTGQGVRSPEVLIFKH